LAFVFILDNHLFVLQAFILFYDIVWELHIQDICQLPNDCANSFKFLLHGLVCILDFFNILTFLCFPALFQYFDLVFFQLFEFLVRIGQPFVLKLLCKIILKILNLLLTQEEIQLRGRNLHLIVAINGNSSLSRNDLKDLLTICLEIVCDYHDGIQE